MRIPLHQIDAFADGLFTGNPVAVCPLEEWLPDDVMQAIAAENNLSETAFFVPEGDGYRLRWFTPTTEVDLCGHATLASATRDGAGAGRFCVITAAGSAPRRWSCTGCRRRTTRAIRARRSRRR